jgi:hypothetical protein
MKPIVMKILPKFGLSSRSGGKYSHGGTARQSRLGYQLDHMSRQTQCGPNHTQIDAAGKDDDSSTEGGKVQGIKKGIAVTTETEIRWHDSTKTTKNGSSTESVV